MQSIYQDCTSIGICKQTHFIVMICSSLPGLDATSSMELLSHLNKLADSNRTVILTIHQPRLEIFHMFHKLVLLSDGRVKGSQCKFMYPNQTKLQILTRWLIMGHQRRPMRFLLVP